MMDDIDLKIMRALQNNARISNQALADKVGLSPSPCWNRVKRLEREGVIKSYVTKFDPSKLGLPDTAIIEVIMERHDDQVFVNFEKEIRLIPEVLEVYLVTGEYDYFIKVAVTGTRGYDKFMRQTLLKVPGIRHTRSSLILSSVKDTSLPIRD